MKTGRIGIKTNVRELACLGGAPLFPDTLVLSKPISPNRREFFSRLRGVMDRHWYSNNGPLVREFEGRMAGFLGVRNAMAVCNATIGLQVVGRALELRGEVIMPAYTYAATPHSMAWLGLTPVFADVTKDTYTLDPEAVEPLITSRTAGILGVHLWGQTCDVAALEELGRKYGVPVFFDAAHAMGVTRQGRKVGGFGAAEVFSLHATKTLHAGEGGLITTNDDALADRIRLLRSMGTASGDEAGVIGTNAKMSELSAALGLSLLDQFGRGVEQNRQSYERYRRELRDVPGVSMRTIAASDAHNFHYVTIGIGRNEASLSRDEVLAVLRAEGVDARRYFYPGCHRIAPYAQGGDLPAVIRRLPVTERAMAEALTLPGGHGVTYGSVRGICSAIRLSLAHARDVRESLAMTGAALVESPCVVRP